MASLLQKWDQRLPCITSYELFETVDKAYDLDQRAKGCLACRKLHQFLEAILTESNDLHAQGQMGEIMRKERHVLLTETYQKCVVIVC